MERRCRTCGHVLADIETEAPPSVAVTPDRAFVRRCYDITTRFFTKTARKVQITDLLDAFFASSIHAIEPDDYESFEARLKERLEAQVPGWDK